MIEQMDFDDAMILLGEEAISEGVQRILDEFDGDREKALAQLRVREEDALQDGDFVMALYWLRVKQAVAPDNNNGATK